jgi:hypothetical protein
MITTKDDLFIKMDNFLTFDDTWSEPMVPLRRQAPSEKPNDPA